MRTSLLLVSSLATLGVGCGTTVAIDDVGSGARGTTSSTTSSTDTPSGPICDDQTCGGGSDGSLVAKGVCDGQSLQVSCYQLGLSFTYQCGCTKNGVGVGSCQVEGPPCDVVGSCCDLWFFPPAGCKEDGVACTTSAECCYSPCTSYGQCGCVSDGEACQADTDCCSKVCNHQGECGCLDDGSACVEDSDCCGQQCDSATGTCITTCQPKGADCQNGWDCCSSVCVGYYCG